MKAGLKVLYILEIFPEISETFILFGILGVQKHGVDVRIVSLNHPKPGDQHRQAVELLPLTWYLKDVPLAEQYAALARVILRHPLRVMKFIPYLYGVEKYVRDTRNRLLQICYLCEYVRRERIGHIHAHFANPSTSFAMWIHMLTKTPYTFSSHGYDIYFSFPKDMKMKTDLAKKHITVSHRAVEHIQEKIGPCSGKLQAWYSGIDTGFFAFRPVADRENILLHVARLHPVKGQEYLLRACKLLKDRGMNFQCLIIGEGSEQPKLEALIRELGLQDICRLLGNKTREEIIPYYYRAKVFVLTSVSEGISNVLKEAMACGLPVVAPRVGGIPELVIDGETGYLFEAGRVEEIAEKIFSLWNDPQKCSLFAQKGRQWIEEEFDYLRQTEKLVAIWKG